LLLLIVLIIFLQAGWYGLVAAQPATPAPTPTPTPTATPTATTSDFLGVGDEVAWLTEAWQRFGWWALLAVVVVVGLLIVRSYGKGILAAIEDQGKKTGAKPFEQLEEQQTRHRQQSAEEAGITAYLDWLRDELQHLPIIPIKSAERPAQLPLQEVYVPLRVVERAQIEGFRKLTLGEFDPAGEYRLREEALEDLERSQRVYRLLSDAERLPAPTADDKKQSRRRTADAAELREETTTRLLLVGDAGSGKVRRMTARVIARNAPQVGAMTCEVDRLTGGGNTYGTTACR
jgi:hypothetical protein